MVKQFQWKETIKELFFYEKSFWVLRRLFNSLVNVLIELKFVKKSWYFEISEFSNIYTSIPQFVVLRKISEFDNIL